MPSMILIKNVTTIWCHTTQRSHKLPMEKIIITETTTSKKWEIEKIENNTLPKNDLSGKKKDKVAMGQN